MLSIGLIKLIETHAESLTREVVQDLVTNEHTPTLHRFSKSELEPRIFRLCHNLGDSLTSSKNERIPAEYVEWGRMRQQQKVPVSEIVYSIILIKHQSSGEPIRRGEELPLELYKHSGAQLRSWGLLRPGVVLPRSRV